MAIERASPSRHWLDWRRILIYTHRWLGIAGCLVFLMWFVSGVVMMYQRMPRLTAEERLARMADLDASTVAVPPANALASVDAAPLRVRLAMLGSRPVYRFETERGWTTVFADTGEPLTSLPAAATLDIGRQLFPESASTLVGDGRITQPDQWTLDGLGSFLPMQRLALGDPDQTTVYVSERTGEPVMKTTRRGRTWGYLGAVIHWTYFTPFRRHSALWRYSIVYAALIGCVMCLLGLAIGIWRYSPSGRFRLKRQPSHSPYAGLMWWHHYAGLAFGLVTFTWALSGALSLTPWDWTPWFDATSEQQLAVSGGPLRLDHVTTDDVRSVVESLAHTVRVKEVELRQVHGRLLASAYDAPALEDALRSDNPDVVAAFAPALSMRRRSVWVDRPDSSFDRIETEELRAAAAQAVPGSPLLDVESVERYDAYYYDRWRAKPLPVFRVRYDDTERTWLYLDPGSGALIMRYTTRSRVNRWLYHGLHSFDVPFLYFSRPAWDIVLILLSAGGIALSVTTVVPAIRRLRRHARGWRLSRPPDPRDAVRRELS